MPRYVRDLCGTIVTNKTAVRGGFMMRFFRFKRTLHVPFYIRYADDFVLLSSDKNQLAQHLSTIELFLQQHLELSLHPDKISIRTVGSGHDFLGWLHFPHHRLPRKRLARRARKTIYTSGNPRILASYLGLISHGDTFELSQELTNLYQFGGEWMYEGIDFF